MKYPRRLQREHDAIYFPMVEALKKGPRHGDDSGSLGIKEKQGQINWSVLRRLAHLSFSPRLERFVAGIGVGKTLAPEIQKYVSRDDYGFALFYSKTRRDPATVLPESIRTSTLSRSRVAATPIFGLYLGTGSSIPKGFPQKIPHLLPLAYDHVAY